MNINDFVTDNMVPIFGMLFLLLVLKKDNTVDEAHKKWFLVILAFEFIEMLAYNLELVTAEWPHPTKLRIFLSAIGYSVRPFLGYLFIKLVKPNEKNRYREVLLIMPVVLATLLAFSAFFTDLAYSYDAQNYFHRGNLGYCFIAVDLVYMLHLIYLVIKFKLLENTIAYQIMLLIVSYITLAMILEATFNIRSVGRPSLILSTIFFLFALQTNRLKTTIGSLEENESKLRLLSETDLMTGIMNRGTGEQQVQDKMAEGIEGVFCLMDCDGFKKINDTYGHSVGDQVIVAIADKMKQLCREEDIVFRLGGDEFAFYLPRISEARQVATFIDHFFESVEGIDLPAMKGNKISISLGAAINKNGKVEVFDELYKKADLALYQSKKKTGCYATIFERDMCR